MAQPSHEARITALEQAIGGGQPTAAGVTLEKHFESRIEALEKATGVAAVAMERRLDGMNEFRDTLRDQAARFATRDEVNLRINTLNDEVETLKIFRAVIDAKANINAVYVSYVLALVGIVLSILSLLK